MKNQNVKSVKWQVAYKKHLILALISASGLMVLSYQGCSPNGFTTETFLVQADLSSNGNLSMKQPGEILSSSTCVSCHSGTNPSGNYDLSTYDAAVSGGRVVPNSPAASLLVQRLRDGSMPPTGPLPEAEIRVIETWVAAGAPRYGMAPPENVPPVVNAGADQTINYMTSTAMLEGTASDSDGFIDNVIWTKISGPNVTMSGADTLTLMLSNLVAGTYVFRLSVVDSDGASAADMVQIIVEAPPVVNNVPPVANAGVDKSITLPINTVSFVGTATDSDGSVASYLWTKISGPNVTLGAATTSTLNVSGITQAGSYVFRFTVTDNMGATAFDDVMLTVNPAVVANVPPTANAGADKAITLPTSTSSFTGSGTDSDGTISSYSWAKTSGPTVTMSGANTQTLSLSAINQAGAYNFRLTVTDNMGATAFDDVILTVNAAPNVAPTANAGADKTITLPTNSVSLVGSGADSDGTISAYLWRQVSGPNTATLANAATATLAASALIQGTYVFELKVTDNGTLTGIDTVNVIVQAAVANPNASFSWILTNVFQPKCLSCHGAGGSAGVDLRTHTSTIKNIRSGNANSSALYTEVNSGNMPAGGSKLPADQITAIRDWINMGAPNN